MYDTSKYTDEFIKLYRHVYELELHLDYDNEQLKEPSNNLQSLQEKLEIKSCEPCKGEGWFDVPSMVGYGSDRCMCTSCKGSGFEGITGQELLGNLYHDQSYTEIDI